MVRLLGNEPQAAALSAEPQRFELSALTERTILKCLPVLQ